MIRVIGQDPAVVARRLRHHAEVYRPMIDAITYGLLFESKLARDNKVHKLVQSRTGPGSYCLNLADGREFHFRPSGQVPEINVYDAYMKGKVIATLRTPQQARMFLRKLV